MRSRSRQSTNAYSGTVKTERLVGGVWQLFTGPSTIAPFNAGDFESIGDIQKPAFISTKLGRYMAYKPVTHYRHSSFWNNSNEVCYDNVAQTVRRTAPAFYYYLQWFGDKLYTPGSSWVSAHPITSFDPSNHSMDHWNRGKPSMNSRANLFVFLGEMKDFKRLWDFLPKKHFSLPSWQKVLRNANNLHLNYNFGWKPFIRDIKNTFRGVSTFESRFAKFLAEQNKTLSRHVADPETTVVTSGYQNYGTNRKIWTDTTVTQMRSSFQFSYSIPPMDFQTLRFKSMLDTLGLAATPSNIWALIPWSFVVDWFVDIGGTLENLSADYVNPWVEFIQGCYSVSESYTRQCQVLWYPDSTVQRQFSAGVANAEYYLRTTGKPKTIIPGFAQTLEADKIRLLASLVASRLL